MKLPIVDLDGNELRQIDVDENVFGIEPNGSVVHQAYVAQMANRRVGGANTKSRGDVVGSTVKVHKQKGLGRSRQGSVRASHRVGGGVAHGPHPHSFAKDLPKQMRRLALRSALSSHAASGTMYVVDGLSPSEPKTRIIADALDSLGIDRAALVVSGEHEPGLAQAARNLSFVKSLPASYLNVVDVVNAHRLVMTEEAVRKIESLWGGENLKPNRGRRKETADA